MRRILFIAALMAFSLGAAAQEKLYEVKSGIVTLEMDMMGQTVVQQLYFDDYGVKQANLSEFGLMLDFMHLNLTKLFAGFVCGVEMWSFLENACRISSSPMLDYLRRWVRGRVRKEVENE